PPTPGGGGFVNLSDVNVKYTIFGDLPAVETCMDFSFGGFVSGGHHIDVGTSCALAGIGDKSNTDPKLNTLFNYGGPTKTQALTMGSPAIDSGGTDCQPPLC